jgi:putative Holliday junction resolvase
MAIDVGQKRVGIAITDDLKLIANGLDTVPYAKFFDFLDKYTTEQEVETIVVGEPRQRDNSASPAAGLIDPFVKKLIKKYPQIRVERYDERYTSKMAFQAMIDSGISKKSRQDKALIDKISATIILQSYMESQSKKQSLK